LIDLFTVFTNKKTVVIINNEHKFNIGRGDSMVQMLKDDIADKIYCSAIDEFYERGYKSTPIRDIAKGAGVSVGLIYTYYENKEALFEAVVKPTYLLIKSILSTINNTGNPPFENFVLKKEMQFIVDLLRHKRKQVLILIDKSSGTKYENAKEEIIDLTKVHIQKHLRKRIKNSSIIDDVFYHILANNFLEGVLEIARHYKNEEWANNMVELLSKQYFYGINFLVK
jgi:AcrR family transcriptional regulator